MNNESGKMDRRRFLRDSASVLAWGAAAAMVPAARAEERPAPADPMSTPGRGTRPYGQRSSFETPTRMNASTFSLTPLQDLHGIMTPSALHFERHHNGVPTIDPAHHRVLIHGLVERPLMFTLEDVRRLPSVSRVAFIECAGNSREGWRKAEDLTVQTSHGLMSTSEWTGVRLSTLLQAAGRRAEATWMLAEGSDAAGMNRSVPLTEEVLEEGLVCYAQNGEALRPEQGYPLRLLLPGWEGNINVKWLRRLKLGQAPFMTRWETSKYTDLLPNGKAYQFSLVMEAKSVIVSPSGGQQIRPGFCEIRGLAWSGRGRIVRVEVTVDAGKTWQVAQLQEPVLSKCHTRFRLPWTWTGHETVLQSRCLDETGYRQPTRAALIEVRGTQSDYHFNGIHSWLIDRTGQVRNVHV